MTDCLEGTGHQDQESSIYPHGTITTPVEPENALVSDDEYSQRLQELADLPKVRTNIQGLSGVMFALTLPMPMEFSILHSVISMSAAMPSELFDLHCEGRVLRPGIHRLRDETTLRIVLRNPNMFTPFSKIATLDIKTRTHGDFLLDLERPYDSLVAHVKAQIQGLINRPAEQFQLYFGNKPIESGYYLWCYGVWDKAPVVLEILNRQLPRPPRYQALVDFVKTLLSPPEAPRGALPARSVKDGNADEKHGSRSAEEASYNGLHAEQPEALQKRTNSQQQARSTERQPNEKHPGNDPDETTPKVSAEASSQPCPTGKLESQAHSLHMATPTYSNVSVETAVEPISSWGVEPVPKTQRRAMQATQDASTSTVPTGLPLSSPSALAADDPHDDNLYSDAADPSTAQMMPIEHTHYAGGGLGARVAETIDGQQRVPQLDSSHPAVPDVLQDYEQIQETIPRLTIEEEAAGNKITSATINFWVREISCADTANLAVIAGIVDLNPYAGATRRSHKITCKPAKGMIGAEIMLAAVKTGLETVKSIQFELEDVISLKDFQSTFCSEGRRTTAGRHGTNDIIRFDVQGLDGDANRLCAVLAETDTLSSSARWVTLYITKLPPPRIPTPPPPPVVKRKPRVRPTQEPVASITATNPPECVTAEQEYVGSPSKPPAKLDTATTIDPATVKQKRRSKISGFAKSLLKSKKRE
ncbi:hypothetical protein VFPPC_12809 [Pochonia chlamydosporia 170]|uniref:Ubiquitin-like domain-containing protein n=1 Tax=Pochonia chlamydosporia 170 TaxID=1380566 RepID=A0A179G428_METCM|nr:hypothetical protein VFPPC_12809 [Pochonia chlamydosporia 170]OAQ72615.1 hypothetical protein VFPPC_12809 [Pochonia chlamydosporia 170]